MKKQFLLCAIFIFAGCVQQKDIQNQSVLNSIDRTSLSQLEREAKAGDASAQNGLGLYYEDTGDLKKAVYWLRKSAEQGLTGGQFNLAYCYDKGIGVAKDEKQAQYWHVKAFKQYMTGAEQGNVNYQTAVAFGYYLGRGIPQDLKKAEYWARKAAQSGDAQGQLTLAHIYMDSEKMGSKNLKKAAYWFCKAAQQGYEGAQLNLALCYEKGYGVPKDEKKAAYWYAKVVEQHRKGAEQGDAWQQMNLGHSYFTGQGVPKDEVQAVMWIKKAAAQGLNHAKQWLKDHGY